MTDCNATHLPRWWKREDDAGRRLISQRKRAVDDEESEKAKEKDIGYTGRNTMMRG